MKIALKSLFRVCCCALPLALAGQTNEGQNFWMGFMEHHDPSQNTMVVMITSKYNTSGTIGIPGHNWEQAYTVGANNVTLVTVPAYAESLTSEVVNNNGIHVTAQQPVSVYMHQYHAMRSEATVVLPDESLGQEYYVMTYTGYDENGAFPSEFVLVGMEDDTEISVTVSDNTLGGHAKGSTFVVHLNAGETYQVQTAIGKGDLTGSYATSDKKFNIFGGCRWTQVPTGCFYRDNLLEQMYPISTWGKQFVSVPQAHMPYDVFRILASEDGTEVSVQGATTKTYTLNAGQFVEYQRSEPTYISSSKPITVAQYLIGSACSGYSVGDPSMLLLNSVEQIRDTVTLYNSTFENITENYISIILKTADLSVTYFDGALLSSLGATIQPIGPNPAFSYALLQVKPGAHTIISGGCGVIAGAYGYGDVESYSYGGGASFKPINAKSLIPEGGCLNDTIPFKTGFKAPRHTLVWDFGDGTTSTDPNTAHVYSALGTYHVTLYLVDNCLDMKDTISRDLLVTLRQSVAVTDDQEACIGGSIALGAVDLPGARYEWTGPNGFFSVEQFPVISKIQPQQAGPYQVIGIISGCATFPATAEVTVNPLPQPNLGADTVVCADDHVPPLLTLSPGNFQHYRWQNNAPAPTFDVLREGQYWVQVTDQNGCSAADSVFIREQCPTRYYIPNVFSPNFDGDNDYFFVAGSDIQSLHLSVYDRWGTLLFESTEIEARWDGTYRGKDLNPGVYAWVAQIEGYRRDGSLFHTTESGSVTLIR